MLETKCICGTLNRGDDSQAGQQIPCNGCWRMVALPPPRETGPYSGVTPAALEEARHRPRQWPARPEEPRPAQPRTLEPKPTDTAIAPPVPKVRLSANVDFMCRCGMRVRAPEAMIGQEIQCKHCLRFIRVPDPKAPPPQRAAEPPPLPPPKPSIRDRFYWVLLLGLVPLFASMLTKDDEESILKRIERALDKHPEVKRKFTDRLEGTEGTTEDLLRVVSPHELVSEFPGGKLDDLAHVPAESDRHLMYAGLTVLTFWLISALLFAPGSAKNWQLLLVGLFTGTLGVGILFILQCSGIFTLLYVAAEVGDFWISMLGYILGIGVCEEFCKAIPILWYFRLGGRLSWRGACLWGMASGVGFGVSEGIHYSEFLYNGLAAGNIYLIRFASCVTLHAVWTASVGITIWKHHKQLKGGIDAIMFGAMHWTEVAIPVLRMVILVAVFHGLYDTFISQDTSELYILALLVAFLSFAWLAWQIESCREADRKTAETAEAPAAPAPAAV